jgi:hypothetical protein
MKFDEEKYLVEMKSLVDRALDRIASERSEFEIYTLSIWTDANAGMSAVNFDTKTNSDAKVQVSNDWNKEYYDQYIEEGDLGSAKLFEPKDSRNCNPADFELRGFEEFENKSLPKNWEEKTEGECWDLLEPALFKVAEHALSKIKKHNIHKDFELAVNGREDWYEFTWKL